MKIGIYTPYSLNPFHPRTEEIYELLKRSAEVKIYNIPKDNKSFINRFFLGFINCKAIWKLKNTIAENELIYIQDFSYLPLAYFGKRKKKKVIYETLDFNVHLLFRQISKKHKILRYLPLVRGFYAWFEIFISNRYTDMTIVNSKALHEYFNKKSLLLFYCSPLEDLKNNIEKADRKAFLYLGWFAKAKGAELMLDIVEKLTYPFFIIGSINEEEILTRVKKLNQVKFYDRMNSQNLRIELSKILSSFFLLGFSLTTEDNLSFKLQELNKDIDYLSMGIPIIGNNRGPTAEKIAAGCGFFVESILSNEDWLDKNKLYEVSSNCLKYYHSHYSREIFRSRLINAIKNV